MNDPVDIAAGVTNKKVQSYPVVNLHPMAGMKNIVRVDGTERRFELSEAAKLRRERAKRAKKNYVAPGVRKAQMKRIEKKVYKIVGPKMERDILAEIESGKS